MSERPAKRRRISKPSETRPSLPPDSFEGGSDSDSSDVSLLEGEDLFRLRLAAFLLCVPVSTFGVLQRRVGLPRTCPYRQSRRRWRPFGQQEEDKKKKKKKPVVEVEKLVDDCLLADDQKQRARGIVKKLMDGLPKRALGRRGLNPSQAKYGCAAFNTREILTHVLGRYPVKSLKLFVLCFCPDTVQDSLKKSSRDVVVRELAERFSSGSWPQDRREEEEEFLAQMKTGGGSQTVCLFFDLGGKTLPRDLIVEILQFVGYDYDLICSVGLLGWDWYFLVLSTWSAPVRVQKWNVRTIPISVFRKAQRFILTTGMHDSKGERSGSGGLGLRRVSDWRSYSSGPSKSAMQKMRFNATEFRGIGEKLNQCERIRDVCIEWSLPSDVTRGLKLLKKVTTLERVERFELRKISPRSSLYDAKPKKKLAFPANFVYADIFPSLQTLIHPQSLRACIGLNYLNSLTLGTKLDAEFDEDEREAIEQVFVGLSSLSVHNSRLDKSLLVKCLPRLLSFSYKSDFSALLDRVQDASSEFVFELPLLESLTLSKLGSSPRLPPLANLQELRFLNCRYDSVLALFPVLQGHSTLRRLVISAKPPGRSWAKRTHPTRSVDHARCVLETIKLLSTNPSMSLAIYLGDCSAEIGRLTEGSGRNFIFSALETAKRLTRHENFVRVQKYLMQYEPSPNPKLLFPAVLDPLLSLVPNGCHTLTLRVSHRFVSFYLSVLRECARKVGVLYQMSECLSLGEVADDAEEDFCHYRPMRLEFERGV